LTEERTQCRSLRIPDFWFGTPGLAVRPGPSAVDQVAVEEVLVSGQVQQAVAREAEEDRPGLAGLLAGPGLVHGRPDRMGGLWGRDDALGAGELDGGFEDLGLGISDRLDHPVLDEPAERRGVAVVPEASGVD